MYINCSWNKVSELQILERMWLYACFGLSPLWPSAAGCFKAEHWPKWSFQLLQSLFSSVVHFMAEDVWHTWKRSVVLHVSPALHPQRSTVSSLSFQTQTSCGSVAALLSFWRLEFKLWLCFHFGYKTLVSRKPSAPVAQHSREAQPQLRISGLASTVCSRPSRGGSLALTDVTQIACDMPTKKQFPLVLAWRSCSALLPLAGLWLPGLHEDVCA